MRTKVLDSSNVSSNVSSSVYNKSSSVYNKFTRALTFENTVQGSCVKSIAECARNMTWQGCTVGMIQCRQLEGLCMPSKAMCELVTGCPDGTVSCGAERNRTNGKPLVETFVDDQGLRKERIKQTCRLTCEGGGGGVLKPLPVIEPLQNLGGKMEMVVQAQDSERIAFKISLASDAAVRRVDGQVSVCVCECSCVFCVVLMARCTHMYVCMCVCNCVECIHMHYTHLMCHVYIYTYNLFRYTLYVHTICVCIHCT